jgi:hypothetical protein
MLFWRTTRTTEDESEQQTVDPGILLFCAEQAVAAIVFHLIDEHAATAVTEESQARTVGRLRQSPRTLSIHRDFWSAMTNTQRLQWLLDESRTTAAFCSDGAAILLEVL